MRTYRPTGEVRKKGAKYPKRMLPVHLGTTRSNCPIPVWPKSVKTKTHAPSIRAIPFLESFFTLSFGNSCDDGNFCTQKDTCDKSGACLGEESISCDDSNACTTDSCDPESGCIFTAFSDGEVCDDGDSCTQGDTCTAGNCVGTGITCTDDGNPCTLDGGCDATGEGCVTLNAPDGVLCEDGNDCTEEDVCLAGTCDPGEPMVCADGNTCTDDTCNPKGGCTFYPNDSFCDDGSACSNNDTCLQGQCVGEVLACDDDNACTNDGCDAVSGCTHQFVNLPCDDGDTCTTSDTCVEGNCASGEPLLCDDGNACTNDNCNPLSGCSFSSTDASCDDGSICTANDQCSSGGCAGATVSCDDENPCTNDSCDPVGGCSYIFVNLPCSDGNLCTLADVCGEGSCQSGTKKVCDDGDLCTDEFCSLSSGECQFSYNTAPCDEGSTCTEAGACVNGSCAGGVPSDCDDGIECTIDFCDDTLGCLSNPSAAACEDGLECTLSACDPDTGCVSTVDESLCDDGVECTDALCDTEVGCIHETNNGNCDDAISCTVDTCDALSGCFNSPDNAACPDDGLCSSPVCNPDQGCLTEATELCCGNGVQEDGEECDDSNDSNGDGCSASCALEEEGPGNGECVPSLPVEYINSSTGTCSNALSLILDAPAGIHGGDLLLAVVTTNNNLPATPNGWTLIEDEIPGGNCGSQTFSRVVQEDDPESYAFPFASATFASGILSAYSNAQINNPIMASAGNVTSAYSPPGIITTQNQTLVVLFTSSGNGGNQWSTPAGWTAQFTGQQNSTSSGAFHFLQESAGPVTPPTATPGMPDEGHAHLIAISVCTPALCGNGVTDAGESCDDGNTINGDGCSSTCSVEEEEPNSGECVPSLPVEYISSTTNICSNAPSLELLTPPGVNGGDLLLAIVTTNNHVPATPEDWTLLVNQVDGGNCGSQTFYRMAEEGGPGVHSFPFASPTYASGILSAYSNVLINAPIMASAGNITSGYTPPGIETTQDQTLLVFLSSSGNGANQWSTPAGWTAQVVGLQGSTSSGAFHRLIDTAGVVNPATATSLLNDEGHAHLIALQRCTLSLCGNGETDVGESCDDGNTTNGDGCSESCTTEPTDGVGGGQPVSGSRRVFVTSIGYTGNLGGLEGADAKCQERANAASLGGIWRAWLSTNSQSAASRLTHPVQGYRRTDGAVISESWTGLVTGSPLVAPELTEYGVQTPYVGAGSVTGCSWAAGYFFHPWTATTNEGAYSGPDCDGWTSTSATGRVGLGGYSLSQWTNWCPGFGCSSSQPLYCFEQ